MNADFNISDRHAIPNDIEDLESNYYLKVSSNSGGHTWKLEKYSLSTFLSGMFQLLGNPCQYIAGKELTHLMKIASNPDEKNKYQPSVQSLDPTLQTLSQNTEFKEFSRSIKNMEDGRTKLKRGIDKAKLIGRGLEQLKENHIPGKMLADKYWIEAVTKRHLAETAEYFTEWETSDTHYDFETWLRLTYSTNQIGSVEYITDDDREQYQIDFLNGIAMKDGQPFHTDAATTDGLGVGAGIFVIDPQNQLYVGSHSRGEFHHSSFLNGAAIQGAGEIRIDKEGHITELTNKSGHYKPSKELMLNTLKVFHNAGVDLSKVKLTFLENGESFYYNSAEKYLKSAGECRCSGCMGFNLKKISNEEYALVLNNLSLSKKDKVQSLAKAKQFLEAQWGGIQINQYIEKTPFSSIVCKIEDYR